ncbi:MAG TPA: calcium/proton exchanger [Gemmataceae bacterium]|nr:calcium/proton exchanger [Gemmataceae bacterium]
MTTDHPTARGLKIPPLYWLLLAAPVALILRLGGWQGVWLFAFSGLAIVPLAGLMGRATEELADSLGPGIGGLLNATFGNAAELIIALFALLKGPQMYDLVKASLTGSIIGNVLLVLGLSILAGGLYHKKQVFNRTAAGMGATLLALACIGLLMPTLYYHVFHAAPRLTAEERRNLESLSEEIAVILAVLYLLSLVFSLKTHQHLFAEPEEPVPAAGAKDRPGWSRRTALLVLLGATAGVAVMSEFLVGSIEAAGHALGLHEVFLGVIVVAIVGNAAEHSTAVMVAMKNKMDLAVTIAVGSSLQIALFVTPVLVFASLLTGHPLDLHFSLMEIVAVIVAIGVLTLVCQDGETHWMEGAMLLGVYVILGLAFYHLPKAAFTR